MDSEFNGLDSIVHATINRVDREGLIPSSVPNLAAFVSSTVGRSGAIYRGDGVVCVRSPVPVANGFVNAAFVIDSDVARSMSIAEAVVFFGETGSPFVVWVPEEDEELTAAAEQAGGVLENDSAPDMWISELLTAESSFEMRVVSGPDEFALCARLCEAAYEIDGMAWLMEHHNMLESTGVTWVVAWDGDEPVGAGCSFLEGVVGGIYYVSTPPTSARRGVAGSVTSWLTNLMLGQGAHSVVLQASAAGYPVYRRLGFDTRGQLTRYRFELPDF
jgi:hypothetical protein